MLTEALQDSVVVPDGRSLILTGGKIALQLGRRACLMREPRNVLLAVINGAPRGFLSEFQHLEAEKPIFHCLSVPDYFREFCRPSFLGTGPKLHLCNSPIS